MSVLILTGNMAYEIVKQYIKPFTNSVKIFKLPISIAAFITPDLVIKQLKNIDLSLYDSIIVPGLMQGSTQPIEDALNLPTFKGPRYASDLPTILKETIQLSKTIPADKLMINEGVEEYNRIVETLMNSTTSHPSIPLKSYKIGIDYPPLILAEIVDAPILSIETILSLARNYVRKGAHMLDIGAIVGQNNSPRIGKIIEAVKEAVDVPISIDSMLPDEIETAVEAGADVILSLDAGNIQELKNLPKDRIVTIIPTNTKEGIFPTSSEKRVQLLIENIRIAKKLGFKKILADPLLESPISPGLIKSLETFIEFRKYDAELPLLFGGGNITEIIDADSIGVNALIACIAIELGVSVILTTEYSNKTRNAINELVYGLKMAFYANNKKRPPVGLPFSLLRAKNKKKYYQDQPIETDQSILVTEPDENYIADNKGFFKIWVDHANQLISVLHFRNSHPHSLIQGTDAEALGKKILSLNSIQDPNHILYLGRELERAEIALFLGKDYVQDLKFAEVS